MKRGPSQGLDPLLRGLRGPRQRAEEVRAVNAEEVFRAKATGRTAKEGSTLWETCSTCANFSQLSTESKEEPGLGGEDEVFEKNTLAHDEHDSLRNFVLER